MSKFDIYHHEAEGLYDLIITMNKNEANQLIDTIVSTLERIGDEDKAVLVKMEFKAGRKKNNAEQQPSTS